MYLEEVRVTEELSWSWKQWELGNTPACNLLTDINKYHIPSECRKTRNEKGQHCEASTALVVALRLFLAGVMGAGCLGDG
jgi:hypothetical protein